MRNARVRADHQGAERISLQRGWPLLLLFVLVVMGIGFVVGLAAPPGDWFEALAKPDFIPAPAVSTPLWLLLCVAFAISGWRLWQINSGALETRLWLLILILSWWYTPVFFLVRSPAIALVVISAMAVTMLVFIVRTWSRDRVSSLLFIPCFLWVAYAAAITAAIVRLN